MDEKQYAIKCDVCGTDCHFLDTVCPNCQAKRESWLFKYFSQSVVTQRLKFIAVIIYSIPNVIIFLLLLEYIAFSSIVEPFFCLYFFYISILSIINTISIFFIKKILIPADYLYGGLAINDTVSAKYFALNLIHLIQVFLFYSITRLPAVHLYRWINKNVVELWSIELNIGNYLKSIVFITFPFFHFRYRKNKKNRILCYRAAYEFITSNKIQYEKYFLYKENYINDDTRDSIYRKFTYTAQENISSLEEAIRKIITTDVLCKDIKNESEFIEWIKYFDLDLYQINYLARKDKNWLFLQKSKICNAHGVSEFLTAIPDEKDAKFARLFESNFMLIINNTLTITLWILLLIGMYQKLNKIV